MHHYCSKSKIPKSSSKKSRVWGQFLLHSTLSLNSTHINLTEKAFTVGRFSDCTLSINEHNVGKRILKHISRRHFILKKQMVFGLLIVRVTDLSFNGTFVNGVKIGKNNTFTLFDGDNLAIGKPNFTIFTFKDLCNGSVNNDHKNIENKLSPNIISPENVETTASSVIYIDNNELDENGNFNFFGLDQ